MGCQQKTSAFCIFLTCVTLGAFLENRCFYWKVGEESADWLVRHAASPRNHLVAKRNYHLLGTSWKGKPLSMATNKLVRSSSIFFSKRKVQIQQKNNTKGEKCRLRSLKLTPYWRYSDWKQLFIRCPWNVNCRIDQYCFFWPTTKKYTPSFFCLSGKNSTKIWSNLHHDHFKKTSSINQCCASTWRIIPLRKWLVQGITSHL